MRHALLRTIGALLVSALALATLDPSVRAATRPPRLDYTMTTLSNGMQVVFLEDHSTPIVHAEIWYHVGSKNERPGRTGFAHLFEHMMFKGSKNVEPEGHPSWISSVGGQSNAYTNEDAIRSASSQRTSGRYCAGNVCQNTVASSFVYALLCPPTLENQ